MTDFTNEELAQLRQAYASGVFWIRLPNGEEVRYDNGAALLERIRFLEARIAREQRPRPVAGRASFRRT